MPRFPTENDVKQTNFKSMSWRDDVSTDDDAQNGDDRPGFGVGQFEDGDTFTVTFETDGEAFESQYGESVRFECVLNDASINVEDFDNNPIPNDTRATMITGSKRLLAALAGVGENLVGHKVRIHKSGEGMDVEYRAERLDATA